MRVALNLAARFGHTEVVKTLLDRRAESTNALFLASRYSNPDVVEALLNAGFAFDKPDATGYTPLLHAAWRNQTEVMKLLLDKGASSNARTPDGLTALHLAARLGREVIAETLISASVDLEVPTGSFGFTPLHYAAEGGFVHIIKLLVKQGAAVEKKTWDGDTALHLAAARGHFNVCQELLNAGIAINVVNTSGQTALHLAAKEGFLSITQILLKYGATSQVSDAARTQLEPVVTTSTSGPILTGGMVFPCPSNSTTSLRESDSSSGSPLELAAQNGHFDVVQKLLNRAIDLQSIDSKRALIDACSGGHLEVLKAILGPDVERPKDYLDSTMALHAAASNGHPEVVKELLSRSVNVDARNQEEWTPLHSASNSGHVQVIEMLLQNGANIEAYTADLDTPIHLAASSGHLLALIALESVKPIDWTYNRENKTALDLAVRNGHSLVVRYLRRTYDL